MMQNRLRNSFGRSNPVYNYIPQDAVGEAVSTKRVVVKTFILLLLATLSGIIAAYTLIVPVEAQNETLVNLSGILSVVGIVFLIIGFIGTMFSIKPIFAFMYAIGYGSVLGVMSAVFDAIYPGVVSTAVVATATMFTVMLFLYSTRIIRVTDFLRSLIMGAMVSFLVFALGIFITSLFSANIRDLAYGNGPLSIGISAVAICLGALMLLLDFDRIEQFQKQGASSKYEWRLAFGLTVTIIWIYVEILKLLVKLASKD